VRGLIVPEIPLRKNSADRAVLNQFLERGIELRAELLVVETRDHPVFHLADLFADEFELGIRLRVVKRDRFVEKNGVEPPENEIAVEMNLFAVSQNRHGKLLLAQNPLGERRPEGS